MRRDLETYLRQMSAWAGVEAETARTLERILATEFVDEAEVNHQIADSRPRVRAHLEAVRNGQPHTPPLRSIHALYVRAWEDLLRGYDAIESGFATAEYTGLARGRAAMTAWRDGILRVARDLSELARRLGVDPGPVQRASRIQAGRIPPQAALRQNGEGPTPSIGIGPSRRSGDVLLSHTATVQYHRRWRA